MARAAARESVTIAGRPERVAVARAFAAAVLGGQHPADETSVLLRWGFERDGDHITTWFELRHR